MKNEIKVDKEILFELLNSHSTLAQAEYKRNGFYNQDHYSHKVELKMIKILNDNGIDKEYYDYSEQNMLDYQ